jgi:pimeloyl-ACP methyl ester carboxylesterase
MKHSTEVVLVHGGWADASSWLPVIVRLQSKGITVSAAHLPLTSFKEDVAALNRHLNSRANGVLVVCHSYGGNVATQVTGTSQKAIGVAYIAALAPDLGKPFGSFLMEHPGEYHPNLTPDANGLLWATEEVFAHGMGQDLSPDQCQVLWATQSPISLGVFGESVSDEGWRVLPCSYLICEDDRILSPLVQETLALKIAARISRLKSGHLPMVSHPDDVTSFIENSLTALRTV